MFYSVYPSMTFSVNANATDFLVNLSVVSFESRLNFVVREDFTIFYFRTTCFAPHILTWKSYTPHMRFIIISYVGDDDPKGRSDDRRNVYILHIILLRITIREDIDKNDYNNIIFTTKSQLLLWPDKTRRILIIF